MEYTKENLTYHITDKVGKYFDTRRQMYLSMKNEKIRLHYMDKASDIWDSLNKDEVYTAMIIRGDISKDDDVTFVDSI